MRLFVSINLPDDLSQSISEIQEAIEPAGGVRLTNPTQCHVTLKFLGEIDPAEVSRVVDGLSEAVETADIAPFEATVSGMGVFPELSYIRVIWLGIDEGATQVTTLAAAVERALVDRGFNPADHSFTPHITIARMDHAGGKELVQRVVNETHPTLGTMSVDEITLTESILTADGPQYETVETIPLSKEDA